MAFSIVYTLTLRAYITYVSLAAIKFLYHFADEGWLLFFHCSLKHIHPFIQLECRFDLKTDGLGQRIEVFKSSMQKYCFWHSNVVFLLGFLSICCCCYFSFILSPFFLFNVRFWSFMCVHACVLWLLSK